MGEIAEALRKANEPVDGSETEADPGLRHNEETSGEITAALSRANAVSAGRIPTDEGDAKDTSAGNQAATARQAAKPLNPEINGFPAGSAGSSA